MASSLLAWWGFLTRYLIVLPYLRHCDTVKRAKPRASDVMCREMLASPIGDRRDALANRVPKTCESARGRILSLALAVQCACKSLRRLCLRSRNFTAQMRIVTQMVHDATRTLVRTTICSVNARSHHARLQFGVLARGSLVLRVATPRQTRAAL